MEQPIQDRIRSSARWAMAALALLSVVMLIRSIAMIGEAAQLVSAPPAGLTALDASRGAIVRATHYALMLVPLSLLISIFYRILRAGTPFVPQVPRRMKALAIAAFLALQGTSWLHDILAGIVLGRNVLGLLTNEGFLGLVIGAACFSLAMIFDYGCRLQQLSDETI